MERGNGIVKSWLFLSLMLVCIGLLIAGGNSVSAAAVYSFDDKTSGVKIADELAYISGQHMVWTQSDDNGYLQVFYKNIKTAETKQITTFLSQKHSPRVGESKDGKIYVIWTDSRDYAAETVWTMYGYELSAGKEWRLNVQTRNYDRLEMNGSELIGSDNYSLNIAHYDLITNKETPVGKGRSPVVADGKVLFINETDGGLSLYTVATGEKKAMLTLPYHLNVVELKFDGKMAFYKQADLDWKTKYVLLETTNPSAQPVDLTPAVKKQNEYYQMFIGDGQVSWVQDNGGVPALYGYNVNRGENYKVAEGDQSLEAIGFDGSDLVMKGQDGTLAFRHAVRTEVPDASHDGAGTVVIQDDAVKVKIGPQGGEVLSKDGSAKLLVPSGALSQEKDIELKSDEEQTKELASSLKGAMRAASKAWQIDLGGNLNRNAKLTLSYVKQTWSPLQTQKMAVYRWDEITKRWLLIGGQVNGSEAAVTVEVADSGIYALLLNDVEFTDGIGHWARNYMEVLASRGVVDGITEKQFVPDGVLTRAQFTKMLLGALEIVPKSGSGGTFEDVKSDHWAAGYVEAAVAAGLVQGDGKHFNPDAELTREQMIVMLVRAIGNESEVSALTNEAAFNSLSYTDAGNISDWAYKYAAVSSQLGLIEGDQGNIRPKDSSTRAQAAAVVYRLLQKMQKI